MDFAETRRLIAAAVQAGAAPAAAIEVGRQHGALWREAFGRLSYETSAPPTASDTIFDLASLTKVIATTSLAMRAVHTDRATLDTPVGDVLPGWNEGERSAVTLRHLLEHSSGLPARVRLWETARGRDDYERAIREVALERPPGTQSVYSDVGFMTLGFALEAIGNGRLDTQFRQLADQWGVGLQFSPPAELAERIAPTEFDAWRGRVIRGEVHDENAAALGGVAGHAGLFGTAADVGVFARVVLTTFQEPTVLGTPSLMRAFAQKSVVPGSSRALGWDTMLPTSSCGTRLSPTAIGHTGFTGTSLWIDWERDLYVVLLTNRVHPTRSNEALLPLRPKIHEAVIDDLEKLKT